MKKLILLFLFLFIIPLGAQNLKLFGTAEPGGIIIGKADNISSIKLGKTKVKFDINGYFVFGFDRDAKGAHLLKIKYKNGKRETKKFVLPKRKYEVQRLRVAAKYVKPPKEELEKINLEIELMKKARAAAGKIDTAYFASGFVRPADGEITSQFGVQRILNGIRKKPHNGLDFSGKEGDPIYSIADGVVVYTGEDFYYNGNFVLIDHGLGLTSIYLHMSRIDVKAGDKVLRGQLIGGIGNTGRSTAEHLHLGVQWYKKRIDPASLLNLFF